MEPFPNPEYLPNRPVSERRADGRDACAKVPLGSHAAWASRNGHRDPLAILELQARDRVRELVPIRYGRMALSSFAFYRGAAAVMAADLAGTARCGLRAQLCGDAHLLNFGLFETPEALTDLRSQ